MRRALPLVVTALAALAAGVYAGARSEPEDRRVAERFVAAWERGDHGAMYELLGVRSRARTPLRRFMRAYARAAEVATLDRVVAGRLRTRNDGYQVPIRAETKRFGTLRATVTLAMDAAGDVPGVRWAPHLAFPGLRPGERLRRDLQVPPRGTLQTRDGQVIATGPDRRSGIGPLAADIAGRVGPIPAQEARRYSALGYPPDAVVGLSGLERQFERRLAGTFGGTLYADRRVLATVPPRPGADVRTSIDPELEAAAVQALAGRLGGIAVLRPRTGEVLALAGIAYSAPQPPGSTFKIVTLAGALDAGVVEPDARYPVQTAATLEGVELENAHGEACGGTLAQSFAKSCNSVFAPLGAELGARRLVEAAERFGFNRPDGIAGAPAGSIPAATEIGDDLAVGSTAIGQGRLLSTPLRMAEIAGAIANHGVLVRPTLLRGGQGPRFRATKARTAAIIRRFMRRVVEDGTGTAAAVPGVAVAGKTGTAELRDTVAEEEDVESGDIPPATDATDTDAWFVGFAPARSPKLAVAVLLVGQGAGGETAAPAAQVVLQAGLGD